MTCENCEREISDDEKSYETGDGYWLCSGCRGLIEAELSEEAL